MFESQFFLSNLLLLEGLAYNYHLFFLICKRQLPMAYLDHLFLQMES